MAHIYHIVVSHDTTPHNKSLLIRPPFFVSWYRKPILHQEPKTNPNYNANGTRASNKHSSKIFPPSGGWASFRFWGDIISLFSCNRMSPIVCSLCQLPSMGKRLGSTWQYPKLSLLHTNHKKKKMVVHQGDSHTRPVSWLTQAMFIRVWNLAVGGLSGFLATEEHQLINAPFMYGLPGSGKKLSTTINNVRQ